jgi:putative ABC transport system substrate-binding protein
MLSVTSFSVTTWRQDGLPELERLGWREGETLEFLAFTAEGDPGRLQDLASRLAASRPDVAIAVSNPAAQALQAIAPRLPIIMAFAGSDPVADGLAQSIARPGGSVTGVVMLADELNLKRVELAREAFPGGRVGYLYGTNIAASRITSLIERAQRIGEEVVVSGGLGTPLDVSFDTFRRAGVSSVVVASSPVLSAAAPQIAALALAAKLPTLTEWRRMVEAGCALSYGPNEADIRRRAARFVGRVLRGERPAEMPMEQPERFELVLNQRTLAAVGANLPAHVLARADEVIE